MWTRYWGLREDPFAPTASAFVPLPGHREAVERLHYAVEAGLPSAILSAGEGLGKSTVLRRALAEARRADRRIVCASAPIDAPSLWRELGDRLAGEASPPRDESDSAAWRRLERAAKVVALQGRRVVLAVDDCQSLPPEAHRLLARLGRLEGVTAILVLRDDEDDPRSLGTPWGLTVALDRLTCSDAEAYLAAKVAAAGAGEGLFSRRAVVRLHAASRGVPRALDRLASAALAAAATRGLEAVPSALVDDLATEFLLAAE